MSLLLLLLLLLIDKHNYKKHEGKHAKLPGLFALKKSCDKKKSYIVVISI